MWCVFFFICAPLSCIFLVAQFAPSNSMLSCAATTAAALHATLPVLAAAPAAERLRREIEAARDSIAARAAELAGLTSALGQQQQEAAAAVAAAALSAREGEVAAAAERLRLLQAQQQEARQALAEAEAARDTGAAAVVWLHTQRQPQ
jgi:hypothetical protein